MSDVRHEIQQAHRDATTLARQQARAARKHGRKAGTGQLIRCPCGHSYRIVGKNINAACPKCDTPVQAPGPQNEKEK